MTESRKNVLVVLESPGIIGKQVSGNVVLVASLHRKMTPIFSQFP